MVYAKVTDGLVVNLVVMEEAQARGDATLVPVGYLPALLNDIPVRIGNTYTDGHFFNGSQRVYTPYEVLNRDIDAALQSWQKAGVIQEYMLAAKDPNYTRIAWGTENKTLNSSSGAEEGPASGEWRRSANKIPITKGDYLYFDVHYPGVRVYDASDDSFLGSLPSGTACPYEAASMYFHVTDEVANLSAKVAVRYSQCQANYAEYVFYDRNAQAIQLNEDATGIRVGEPRPAGEWDALTLGDQASPMFPLNYYWTYLFKIALVQHKTYLFFRYATETDAEVFVTSLAMATGDGNSSWRIVKNESNCLLTQWYGDDVAELEARLYCYWMQIKDGSGVDYESGFRVDQIAAFVSQLPADIIFDVLAYGGNAIQYLLHRALLDVAWQGDIPETPDISQKADAQAILHGYTNTPFGAADWGQGNINATTGAFLDDPPYHTTRIRFETFFDSGVELIRAAAGYLINTVFFYNAAEEYQGCVSVQATEYSDFDFEDGKKYRFTVKKADDSDIDVSEYGNILILNGKIDLIDRKLPYLAGDIRFTVSVNQTFDDNGATADEAQDGESMADVSCLLRLPSAYTPSGTPTKLVLAAHGAGYWIASPGTGSLDDFADLLSGGYALFDANGSNDDNPTHCGSPRAIQALYKAYQYIVENYNVDPVIFVAGVSMGGTTAVNFTNLFPAIVRAVGLFCPRLNVDTVTIDSTPYAGTWDNPSYQDIVGAEYNFDTYSVYEADKVCGYNPYLARSFANGAGERCTMFPVPIKIWHGTGDPTTPYQVSAEFAAQIKRAGVDCRLRLIAGVGHGASATMKAELPFWFNRFR